MGLIDTLVGPGDLGRREETQPSNAGDGFDRGYVGGGVGV